MRTGSAGPQNDAAGDTGVNVTGLGAGAGHHLTPHCAVDLAFHLLFLYPLILKTGPFLMS